MCAGAKCVCQRRLINVYTAPRSGPTAVCTNSGGRGRGEGVAVTDRSISRLSAGTHYALVMVFATHSRLHSLSFPSCTPAHPSPLVLPPQHERRPSQRLKLNAFFGEGEKPQTALNTADPHRRAAAESWTRFHQRKPVKRRRSDG